MKRIALVSVALALLLGGAAHAEPDMLVGSAARILTAGEAVYLLVEPSEDAEVICELPRNAEVVVLGEVDSAYTRVHYNGQKGCVPSQFLDCAVGIGGLSVIETVTQTERTVLNGFLSTFSQTRIAATANGVFRVADPFDPILREFGIACVALEEPWLVRDSAVPYDAMDAAVLRYCGAEPLSITSYVDLTVPDDLARGGFACLTNLIDLGSGDYLAYFNVYATDGAWTLDARVLTESAAAEKYPGAVLTGRARIHAENLGDPSTISLSEFIVNE